MELRQLTAFVAVATELHFGRAAEQLHISQPTLTQLVQRLEREVGTPLLTRTTRRVALTAAGTELLKRCKIIIDEVDLAKAAVLRVAHGETGTVRVAITPPVAPVLAPHLRAALRERLPDVKLDVERMWLPDLIRTIAADHADVAITCGVPPNPPGVVGRIFCSEPLLVGVRKTHPLADCDAVSLDQLARDTLGVPNETLFPAWALTQRQALEAAAVSPPTTVLAATGFSSTGWSRQPDVTWVLLSESLGLPPDTAVLRIHGDPRIPYVLQWAPERIGTAAIRRFVDMALTMDAPPGWRVEPGRE